MTSARSIWCTLVLLLMPMCLYSQVDHGAITGTVTDPSGAVLGAVQVTAVGQGTNASFAAHSNDHGAYTLLNLPIGTYNLEFKKQGFKTMTRTGIAILTEHTSDVSVSLEIGAVSETVTVQGSPVLDVQTEVGTNVSSQAMTDLPLSVNGGRNIQSFAFAATPNVSGNGWTTYVAGGQAFTTNILIDGTSADSGIISDLAESQPSMDAIQESQVDTSGLRAEDGRTGGGVFMYEMKSGTNQLHGSVYGFLANEFLDANTWDNKWWLSHCAASDRSCINQYKRAMNRYFDYGFSAGGPVWRNKMFIFGAYEKYLQSDWRANPTGATVPTAKMTGGDFSELLTAAVNPVTRQQCTTPCPILSANGQPYTDATGNTIYYGSIFQPNGNVFAGNVIPSGQISPFAQKILGIYKQDYQPTGSGVTNNYPSLDNGFPWFHQTQVSFKYDYEVRSADHVSASYIYNLRPRYGVGGLWQKGSSEGGPLTAGNVQTTIASDYRVSETHIFTSKLLNTISYTFNSFCNKGAPMTGTTNWAQKLGIDSVTKAVNFPVMTFGGSPNGVGESSVGSNAGGGYVAYNGMLNDAISWVKGRHSMKFGTEIRAIGMNHDQIGGPLTFNFSNNTYAPTSAGIQPFVGSAFANMELGEVQSANEWEPFNLDSRRKELAFFGQDDFRLTPKLVISADIRWELTNPLRERHGYWSNFDVNVANPNFGSIPGTITWLKHPSDSFETNSDWHQFAPHLGASYLLTSKVVLRGSFGLSYVPLGNNDYSGIPYGAAVGYQASNLVQEVAAQTPAYQWDKNVYPGVLTPGSGPQPISTYIPWGPPNVDPNTRKLGFVENWNAGLEYELPGNTKIEASYIGSTGRNLHDGALMPTNFPQWSTYQKLLSSGSAWNWVWDSASAAASGVPYPYPGFSGPAFFAINPFPQVQAAYASGVYFTNSPLGQSGYNAFALEGVKQKGYLNLDLSYNLSRTTGNTGSAFIDTWTFNYWFQDPYKYKSEARYAQVSQVGKGYVTYDLPFGSGRRFLSESSLLNVFVGGWKVGTTLWYGNGGQMGAIGSTNYYPGWSGVYTNVVAHPNFKNTFKHPNFGSSADSNSLFVDPSNFSNPTYGQLGNSPRIFGNWRGWATPQESASLLKKSHFGSDNRYTVILRAEFFNLFNRHYWGGMNTNFASPLFGDVTSVSGNRTGQLGARFEF